MLTPPPPSDEVAIAQAKAAVIAKLSLRSSEEDKVKFSSSYFIRRLQPVTKIVCGLVKYPYSSGGYTNPTHFSYSTGQNAAVHITDDVITYVTSNGKRYYGICAMPERDFDASDEAEDAALSLVEIQPTTMPGVLMLLDYVEHFNAGGVGCFQEIRV